MGMLQGWDLLSWLKKVRTSIHRMMKNKTIKRAIVQVGAYFELHR
jgi:hypothetical protein